MAAALLLATIAAWAGLVGWLTWELKFIHERRSAANWLRAHGGHVIPRSHAIEQGLESYCPQAEIPFWRRWLGDETAGIVLIGPRAATADRERIANLFAETPLLDAVENSP